MCACMSKGGTERGSNCKPLQGSTEPQTGSGKPEFIKVKYRKYNEIKDFFLITHLPGTKRYFSKSSTVTGTNCGGSRDCESLTTS